MSALSVSKLKVGGTLGLADLYIRRTEDEAVFELLAAGEFCNILTSRQMGKSSLMVRLMKRLQGELDARIASLDMAGDLGTPADTDDWYIGFLDKIALDLGLQCDVEEWWRREGRGTANLRLLQFFRNVVGARTTRPVFIFIDEVDASLKLPYSDDLFLAIRSMYNQRASIAEYRKLTFCLVGVASPGELIKGHRTTPYNIGQTVELRDFDPKHDDLTPLYTAMSIGDAPGAEIVQAVLRHSGGQPFLTLALCARALTRGVRTASEIDDLVKEVLLMNTKDALASHLESINTFLSTRLHNAVATLRLYDAALRGKHVRAGVTSAHLDLRLSGLVKRDAEGFLMVRNPFYRHRFGRGWLTQTRPMKAQARLRLIVFLLGFLLTITVGLVVYLANQPRQSISDALEELESMDDPIRSAAKLDEICVAVRDGATMTRAQLDSARAHIRKASAKPFEEAAQRARYEGEFENALILGVLAGIKRGQFEPWMRELYNRLEFSHLLATLRGHNGRVLAVRRLNDDLIVSIGNDHTIRIFDLDRGRDVRSQSLGELKALEVCPDGSCILAVTAPKSVHLLTGELVQIGDFTVEGSISISSLSIDPSDIEWRTIAIGDEQGVARVGRLPRRAEWPRGPIDLKNVTAFRLKTKGGQSTPEYSVRFSRDGKRLITAGHDGVHVIDLLSRAIDKLTIPSTSPFRDVRLAPGGPRIVITTERQSLVYDLAKREIVGWSAAAMSFRTTNFHTNTFYDVDNVLSSATTEEGKGFVAIWRVQDSQRRFSQVTSANVLDAEMIREGVVATAHDDGTIRIWGVGPQAVTAARSSLDDPALLWELHTPLLTWSQWERKLGLTVNEENRVVPLGTAIAQRISGHERDFCGDSVR